MNGRALLAAALVTGSIAGGVQALAQTTRPAEPINPGPTGTLGAEKGPNGVWYCYGTCILEQNYCCVITSVS